MHARVRRGAALQRPAHPRRRDDGRAARRSRSGHRVDRTERGSRGLGRNGADRSRRRARARDPRVVPARGAAARALRPRDRAPSRWRRDRPAAARHARPRVRGTWRRRRDRRRVRALDGRAARHSHVPRRGVGDGNGERHHGRGSRRGRDGSRERGLRAAHPGSLPLPRLDRCADRRCRLERPPHHGAARARRRRLPDRPGPHRGRVVRRARCRNRRRDRRRGRRARRPDLHRPGLPKARDRDGGR